MQPTVPPARILSSLLFLLLGACAVDLSQPQPGSGAEIEDIDDLPTPSDDFSEDSGLDSGIGGDERSDQPQDTGEIEETVQTVTYSYGASDSLLYIEVWKDESAWGSGWAHDHVIRASNWTGTVDYHIEDLGECTLRFSVPVDDLIVDESSMREYVGLDGEVSSSDRETVKEHMLGSDQLYSARYAEIDFQASSCTRGSGGALVVSGSLTIRGQTEQVSTDLDMKIRGGQLYLSGVLDIRATQFGFDPYEAYAGAVRNLDEMRISLDLVGTAE